MQINIKSFNTNVETLEKLADGINKHAAEADFPASLKETKARELRESLETKRARCEMLATELKQAYADYQGAEKETDRTISGYSSMLYGFYGKKNPVVGDFGLKTHRTAGKKKKTKAA